MKRLAAILLSVALGGAALADDDPGDTTPVRRSVRAQREPRAVLEAAFADQRDVIERSAAAVATKVTAAQDTRAARAHAAYRALRAEAATTIEQGMGAARRRAAVRWLLARDRAELALLADEARRLETARVRTVADAETARTAPLPAGLAWPASGEIIRRFGVYEHDRSRAVLSRRGLDLVVLATAKVVAPAAGAVRYAGPIRGLDHGVVIDHGTYLTVIGKLAPPAVQAGADIAAGALVGRPAKRRVYVEVRVKVGPGGTPIDPESVLPPMQHAR